MGMFDTVGSEQVKCFDCELKHYNIGDKVPCKEFGFDDDLLLMPFRYWIDDCWRSSNFVIIKGGRVIGFKTISALMDIDFSEISQVITYQGDRIKIATKKDLIEYIEDIMILKVKDDMNDLRGEWVDNYKLFAEKWVMTES